MAQAIEAVYERVRTSWTSTPFTFEAESYVPPATAFIRVKVAALSSDAPSHGPVGGRHVQRRASVIVQCLAPVAAGSGGDGVKAAVALAEAVQALFEGVDLLTVGGGALSFTAVEVRPIGVIEARWRQVNVTAPFTYDATF